METNIGDYIGTTIGIPTKHQTVLCRSSSGNREGPCDHVPSGICVLELYASSTDCRCRPEAMQSKHNRYQA